LIIHVRFENFQDRYGYSHTKVIALTNSFSPMLHADFEHASFFNAIGLFQLDCEMSPWVHGYSKCSVFYKRLKLLC